MPDIRNISTYLYALEDEIAIQFRHRVQFSDGVFDTNNPILRDLMLEDAAPGREPRAIVILDDGASQHTNGLTEKICSYFTDCPGLTLQGITTMSGGEKCKNGFGQLQEVLDAIQSARLSRHCYTIAVGGGAILDLVGFASSITHRGIRHIRVPTTALSQGDGGVGIKNSINYLGLKNVLGAFAPPWAVVNDLSFLLTLSLGQLTAGFAEAIKVALICDKDFFEWIEANQTQLIEAEPIAVRLIIQRSAELHFRHITTGGDPFEFYSSRPLDFGHWAAHKLEQLSNFSLCHGDAVSIGIALDSLYSEAIGLLSAGERKRIVSLLESLQLPTAHPRLSERDSSGKPLVLTGLEEFREHLGGTLTITLLKGIGVSTDVHEIDLQKMCKCLSAVTNT